MCGENFGDLLFEAAACGSSPRVRGKLRYFPTRTSVRGLIPACAGKTRRRPHAHRPRRGSSPRVRGKRFLWSTAHGLAGLIPACAGKTQRHRGWRSRSGAHPRVCGENSDWMKVIWKVSGSSPRVRGKLPGPGPGRRMPGLIPACAGKTGTGRASWMHGRAHPRVCGENRRRRPFRPGRRGSSPRVRGKPSHAMDGWFSIGLIPACAGKTYPQASTATFARAHPRVCGENTTPAKSTPASRAHPRVCGENSQP